MMDSSSQSTDRAMQLGSTPRRFLRPRALVLVAALGLMAIGGGVATDAQDDTSDPWAQHPMVGEWIVDTAPADGLAPTDTAMFRDDGTMIEAGPAGRGAGIWIPTDERTVTAVFNVPWEEEGGFEGFVTVRTNILLSLDGGSFLGTYTAEGPDAAGLAPGGSDPASVTGVRLTEQPQAEPDDVGG